jgi:alpha-tubulin suppressor-like RCC1 family protein
VSCGESHAALISSQGKVYTWGSGENGALGHGNKQSQNAPKLVNALQDYITTSVSCGPYHTAFISGREDEISYLRIPPSSTSSQPIGDSDAPSPQDFLTCASLFTCGLGKAGQLGHGKSIPMMRTPQEVTWFKENGYKVAKASCGMHHTLTIAVPIHAMRTFLTSVLSFGWGEYGRLGTGREDNALFPTLVLFPEPCHAIDISAGEQHSLATSGRIGGCYSWGSNGFGQCGMGSPTLTEMYITPTKVAIPEGMPRHR